MVEIKRLGITENIFAIEELFTNITRKNLLIVTRIS